MDYGHLLTRATVWLALSLYVAAEFIRSRFGLADQHSALLRPGRVLNSLGCALFLGHVVCAFHFYHHWSHAAAYADIARQTRAYFGFNWGGGLYFNYLFLLLWVGQTIRSWNVPAGIDAASRQSKPTPFGWMMRAFILMMIVNGAVIFAHGLIRWFGLLLTLVLIWSWWAGAKHDGVQTG